MKKGFSLLLCILILFVLSACQSINVVDVDNPIQTEEFAVTPIQTEEPAVTPIQTEEPAITPGESAAASPAPEGLPELPKTFVFSSGAGAWSTEIHINSDGTFTGYFSDVDMGDSGDDYPNGTMYECNFSGKFTDIKKIDDYTYSMKIEPLDVEGEINAERREGGVRIISTEPSGFDDADEFLLYLPGIETATLPKEFLEWVGMPNGSEVPKHLPFYGLYNVNGKEGFSSY